ncbi:MAG TPA: HEAT repeat domain-containing protein [Steroidobacteraceae bacterium]|jgi:HEAT repeat protein
MQPEDNSTNPIDDLAGSLGETERREFEDTWAKLGEIPAMRVDSDGMRARFRQMLVAEQPKQKRNLLGEWLKNYLPLKPVLQACAALLLVLIGIQVGRETRPVVQPAAVPEVRELSQEVRDLRQMVTLSLMQQESAAERLKGVSWSNQLQSPGNEVVAALIDTLMHDGNVNVRLASIDALKRFSERDVVRNATLQALGTQTSPLVQMALIDFVVETQDRQAIDTLRRLSSDDKLDATVRARAKWGIGHLEAA